MEKISEKNIVKRPPVVVVMGHVDHGKTTILDKIRKTNVVEKEAGGITQHIGAYEIWHTPTSINADSHADQRGLDIGARLPAPERSDGGQVSQHSNQHESACKITFLDTPGHEAFSQMRARGAKVADVAVLVVAADDGVKAQTKEALGVIQEAKLPFVVAINKIDRPGADSNKVKGELAELGVLVEGWGGNVPVCEVSAKQGIGLEHLLELILLVSELEELKGDFSKTASGVIIEAHRDERRGATGTFLIKDGKLQKGDCIVYGGTFGSIKILEDFRGESIEEATSSSPVVIAGLPELPQVGEEFKVCESRSEAETLARKAAIKPLETVPAVSTAKLTVPVVVKADTAGSLEALEGSLAGLSTGDVTLQILKKDVGSINESDTKLAQTTPQAIVVGFRVKIDFSAAALLLRTPQLPIFTGAVIYEVVDQVAEEIKKRLIQLPHEEICGKAVVLALFRKSEDSQVIGVRIFDGIAACGSRARIIRNSQILGEVKIRTLKRGKDEVKEAGEGLECGMEIESLEEVFRPAETGDILEIISR